jgi:two-component system CheB/CheR fusion protein
VKVGDMTRNRTGSGNSVASHVFPVVGVGASAGGLEACKSLFGVINKPCGMAFILVQHLDPTHPSMMVELLAGHTAMTVVQAADGMRVETEHVYVIPPGAYLLIVDGALRLTEPNAHHGARLPFDFLLRSLASELGARAMCIVLSGTGGDGSIGLKSIHDAGGYVIAQRPEEAGYDGMPRSAIETGSVDAVLPVAEIPKALADRARRSSNGLAPVARKANGAEHNVLLDILALLREKSSHDFTHYKAGTLQRRIERRMALAGLRADAMSSYLRLLKTDSGETQSLASDLLIHVTSFFRDTEVFEYLAKTVIPELVREQALDTALRVWIAGCSTGEETYSLAMLFSEEITAVRTGVKLQIFASDIDPEAVTSAREGFYSAAIEADVSSQRLARFFAKEEHGYRILPELRDLVIFTVQDVLCDPPFARLDMISCRNLLIYLQPNAQKSVIARFHFALRKGGVLALGSAETVGDAAELFEAIGKTGSLFRRVGRTRPVDVTASLHGISGTRAVARRGQDPRISDALGLADLCRRLVTEAHSPATVLVNQKFEYLYSLGPIDRYLRVAPGHATNDFLAMVSPTLRAALRTGLQQAANQEAAVVIPGGFASPDGLNPGFSVSVERAAHDGDFILMVCFLDNRAEQTEPVTAAQGGDGAGAPRLGQELEIARADLKAALRNLEVAREDQKAVNEEAMSVTEEFQATNEELLASKEELQSLNEELTALNGQLQETLERQRTTSSDLQNVLYSTNVATIFLDANLDIRFFTPATRSLFKVIPSDVGRPLADLSSLAVDDALPADARTVLRTQVPIELEIEARSGAWYMRRILPYRTDDKGVAGVVITFTETTERRRTSDALKAAEQHAQSANAAKSRFLAAASHDLRQPLQTLALVQGLLAKTVEGERATKLVARLDDTLSAMAGMLNALLDINQIEAGTVQPEVTRFAINDLLNQLSGEFAYQAQAQRLSLRVVPCSLKISSDPRLLEQMIRNLVSNALKYTPRGKVLIGCRRYKDMLSIEVRDSGIGIPDNELQSIFEEYHQLDNVARERSRGLGLGLSIVKRLGGLLGHSVRVQSKLGRGSMFAIEVNLRHEKQSTLRDPPIQFVPASTINGERQGGTILVVEDDPEVRELIQIILKEEGYFVEAAADGIAAMEILSHGVFSPDLVLADYNLPNGMDGLQAAAKVQEKLHRKIPVIILTGDISTRTLGEISRHHALHLNKPVKMKELTQAIHRLLAGATAPVDDPTPNAERPPRGASSQVIHIVDDDPAVRGAIRDVLEDAGRSVETSESAEAFLEIFDPARGGCILIDAYLPGMSGIELLKKLRDDGHRLPSIMITGNSDVTMAVQAMKAGAADFVEKPITADELIAIVERALEQSNDSGKLAQWRESASASIAGLTNRQREVMDKVLAGHPSKIIAADLGISQRTVENHRAAVMKKTGSRSIPALVRLTLAADG